MVPFNRVAVVGTELNNIQKAIASGYICGDGLFSRQCETWFEQNLRCHKALLTSSCTHALEMAALLLGIGEGDEVIMPSFTFVSTANAFVLRGAKIVFIDIKPESMNLDEKQIESAITPRTKAIVVVHYAGVACEMDTIMEIAHQHGLVVVEDAAQAIASEYKGRPLGTIGHLGTYSFHETKNISSGGEGGLLIINDEALAQRAEIIREKGTNRKQFFRGEVDKYSWVDVGSSYLASELQAAYLYAQLESIEKIISKRREFWNRYYDDLSDLQKLGSVTLPRKMEDNEHNGHIFWLKLPSRVEREKLLAYLRKNNIIAVFHYVPLHSSEAGKRFGRFYGDDRYTSAESERLVRLPLFYNMSEDQRSLVVDTITQFFRD